MKKRITSLLLVVIMMMALVVPAFAVETAATPRANDIMPGLTFNGTTATCLVWVAGDNTSDYVTADIELWSGNRRLEIWAVAGYGWIDWMDTYSPVTSGTSYTLKVYASFNGTSVPMVSITRTP